MINHFTDLIAVAIVIALVACARTQGQGGANQALNVNVINTAEAPAR